MMSLVLVLTVPGNLKSESGPIFYLAQVCENILAKPGVEPSDHPEVAVFQNGQRLRVQHYQVCPVSPLWRYVNLKSQPSAESFDVSFWTRTADTKTEFSM